MAKGGSAPKETTVTQTSLPKYAKPYFTDLLNRTQAETQRGYDAYSGERLADTNQAIDMSRDMVTSGGLADIRGAYMPAATSGMGAAFGGASAVAGRVPYAFSDPAMVGATDRSGYNFGDVSSFNDSVGDYMSPYMQNVVDIQKQQAIRDFDISQSQRDAQAVQAGAFGGSRGAVVDALAQEDLARRLGEIQATGQQSAFQSATSAFENERAARMQREAERAGEYGRSQELNAQLDVGDRDASMLFDQMSADDRARWGELGLNTAQLQGDLSMGLADLGNLNEASYIREAQLYDTIGQDIRADEQAGLDLGYEDFIRQRDYPREQLQFYSSILRGVPIQPSTESTTLGYYNPLSQALGTGISALGLYNSMR